MARIPASLVLLAALALASTAVAGPSPAAAPPKPTPSDAMCPTPNAAKCTSATYIGSVCFARHKATCAPFVEAAMKSWYDASTAPTVETLTPNATEIPRDLKQGKYLAYEKRPAMGAVGAPPVFDKVTSYSVLSPSAVRNATTSNEPPVDRVTHVDPNEAKKAVRNRAWIDNGHRIGSCEEYAYEKNYDYARYLDAIKACKGDDECELAITMLGARPGIASRTLKDRQGNPLPRQIVLPEAAIPKNIFFSLTAAYAPSAPLHPEIKAKREQLAAKIDAHVAAGKLWYGIGDCPGCSADRNFRDAWKWHASMHTRTKTVSDAERSIYAARWNAVLDLQEAIARAEDRWKAIFLERHLEFQVEMPWDVLMRDGIEQLVDVMQHQTDGKKLMNDVEALLGPGFTSTELRQFENQVLGIAPRTTSPVQFLAAPVPKPSGGAPTTKKKPRPKVEMAPLGKFAPTLGRVGDAPFESTDPCDGPEDWPLVLGGAGPAVCQLRQLLIAEYTRHELGQGSCLDYGSDDCDWYPWNFEAMTVDAVPTFTTEDADLAFCRTWQVPNMFTTTTFMRVKDVTARLVEEQQKLVELQQKMGPYVQDVNGQKRLRGMWGDADQIGDKNLFAIGYSYDLGWDAGLTGAAPSGQVCEVAGDVHAGIDFSAWIAGSKKTVIDVALAAKVENAAAKRKIHLKLLGQQVYPGAATGEDGWSGFTGGTTWNPTNVQFETVTPIPSPPPRFDIYVGVPISGELWGELLYGVDTQLEGKAGTCDNPGLAIGGELKPFFIASGRGQVGVGISGIVSAGVRASLNLLTIDLPFDLRMTGRVDAPDNHRLVFDSRLQMLFGTLSGYLAAYIEFLGWSEEWEFFRWKGFGPARLDLMPNLETDVPLTALTR